jgi:MFS family permease
MGTASNFSHSKNYSIEQIGIVAGIYPVVWGVGQLFTGKLGDTHCKSKLFLQACYYRQWV